MNIHVCDICKLIIPENDKYLIADYKKYPIRGFAICKQCGGPVIAFLKEHQLIEKEE
jgi:hypothetical protein